MRNGLRHCDGMESWNVAGSVEKEMRPRVMSGVRRADGEGFEEGGVCHLCCDGGCYSSCFALMEVVGGLVVRGSCI